MKKIIIVIFSFFTLQADNISPTSNQIRSNMLPDNNLHIKSSYALINKGLDVFGIRSSTVGELSDPGSIGDFSTLELSTGYGINHYSSLFYTYKHSSFDFMGETLDNNAHELFVKLGIYYNPHAIFDAFSVDFGLLHNSGNDLDNSQMDDMSDSSFYIRMVSGSKIRSSLLNLFLSLSYTNVYTTIADNSYDRDEYALNGGFNYTLELGKFLIETGYDYTRLFVRDVSGGENSNHHLNFTLSKVLNKQFLMFLGADFYINQLNGVIPYLYNEQTKNAFDQRFGYVKFGLVYHFDTGEFPKR